MPKKKKAPPALGNESDGEQEEEEEEKEEQEQEPLRVPSAVMAVQQAIVNMQWDGDMDEEEEKQEQEPPRVPSAVFFSVPQDQLRIAHEALREAMADLRAASGIASESDEEQLGPNRGLTYAMVRGRQSRYRVRGLERALADLQAAYQAWGLARGRLLSWQDNDTRLARRHGTEAEANRVSEERQLREAVDISARASAAAMQEYQRAFTMLRQQEASVSSEESSETGCLEQEENEVWEEPSIEDSSETSQPSRGNEEKATISDDGDNESRSFEIMPSKKEEERPAKRTRLWLHHGHRPSLLAQDRMRRLGGRRYQTRETARRIQRQTELDA